MSEWKVIHDGPSRPMIIAPDGSIYKLEQLGRSKYNAWGAPEREDELVVLIVAAINAFGDKPA